MSLLHYPSLTSEHSLNLLGINNPVFIYILNSFQLYYCLIRWGFFINAGLDIYSRYITYLEVSPDNDAQTVLSHFRKGVAEKGLPVSVRLANFLNF